MSILPDKQIKYLCDTSNWNIVDPLIDPYDPDQVEPASYDVRLGNDFKIFQRDETPFIDFNKPADITKDVRVEDHQVGFLLHPGEFVLGVTLEKLHMPDNVVARIEGKSSVGRLGLMVHVTAGFIDPGFRGPVTLEMVGVHPLPLLIHPGMLIAQISFQWMAAPAEKPYQGRYQDSRGVESSKYAQGD